MTVKELIAVLQRLNPELVVVKPCGGDCAGCNPVAKLVTSHYWPMPDYQAEDYSGRFEFATFPQTIPNDAADCIVIL